jgi:enoyl-CoA hydratase/carnithine racemase
MIDHTSAELSPTLLIEGEGAVRVLTLNRPDALNATDEELHGAIDRVWSHLAADRDARVVVLTGAGRAFSAGGDLELLRRMSLDEGLRRRVLDEANHLVREIVRFPLPIVAAVNGPAVGLGCTIASLCDVVIVEEQAYFADPHLAIGLVAGDGGAVSWPGLMGLLRAKEYMFTGDRIPAVRAYEIGLANRVVPAGASRVEAVALAQRLAAVPADALQATKRALNAHLQRSVDDVLDHALATQFHSHGTDEHKSLVARFLRR